MGVPAAWNLILNEEEGLSSKADELIEGLWA
jgi:hypothetical protein